MHLELKAKMFGQQNVSGLFGVKTHIVYDLQEFQYGNKSQLQSTLQAVSKPDISTVVTSVDL